jgi:hypothetical protein
VAPEGDKDFRVVRFDLVGGLESGWRLKDMQAGDGGQIGLRLAQNIGDPAPLETHISELDGVPRRSQRGRQVHQT